MFFCIISVGVVNALFERFSVWMKKLIYDLEILYLFFFVIVDMVLGGWFFRRVLVINLWVLRKEEL